MLDPFVPRPFGEQSNALDVTLHAELVGYTLLLHASTPVELLPMISAAPPAVRAAPAVHMAIALSCAYGCGDSVALGRLLASARR